MRFYSPAGESPPVGGQAARWRIVRNDFTDHPVSPICNPCGVTFVLVALIPGALPPAGLCIPCGDGLGASTYSSFQLLVLYTSFMIQPTSFQGFVMDF